MTAKKSTLKRPIQKMPPHVREALELRALMDAYKARPPYQRNDYLRWVAQAVRPETKMKRLMQMLAELEKGDRYMGMKWSPK